mmetsp:Transcript_78162/g.154926  ORF Transcript_78162/g.154926 Transcript_78162/m.154926 type:complete len:124 (+) Transcript_78162:67-438(+)
MVSALVFKGLPETYKSFEAGTFVYNKDIHGKQAFVCAFRSAQQETAESYTLWWDPLKSIYVFGPAKSEGTSEGFFYVPGDEATNPTDVKMQWLAYDTEKGEFALVPGMRCEAVTLAADGKAES